MTGPRIPCSLCGRRVLPANLTRHHVVPKSRGGRDIELICKTCHRQIHALFGNRKLQVELGTIERLRADPGMARYLEWVSQKNPDRYFRGKTAGDRPG